MGVRVDAKSTLAAAPARTEPPEAVRSPFVPPPPSGPSMRATPSMRDDAAEIHARMLSRDELGDRSDAAGLSVGLYSSSPASSAASAR